MASTACHAVVDFNTGGDTSMINITLYDGNSVQMADSQGLGRSILQDMRDQPFHSPFDDGYVQRIMANVVKSAGGTFDGSNDTGMVNAVQAAVYMLGG